MDNRVPGVAVKFIGLAGGVVSPVVTNVPFPDVAVFADESFDVTKKLYDVSGERPVMSIEWKKTSPGSDNDNPYAVVGP